jgi:PTH2 family peptidyl-tRNA hydrolase
MSPGKAIAQAGHAYLEAALGASGSPEGDAYAMLCPGTKITLAGGSEADMWRMAEKLRAAGLTPYPIIDRDHVELPHFDGSPTLTAIGLGPISRDQAPGCLRKLKLFGKD